MPHDNALHQTRRSSARPVCGMSGRCQSGTSLHKYAGRLAACTADRNSRTVGIAKIDNRAPAVDVHVIVNRLCGEFRDGQHRPATEMELILRSGLLATRYFYCVAILWRMRGEGQQPGTVIPGVDRQEPQSALIIWLQSLASRPVMAASYGRWPGCSRPH